MLGLRHYDTIYVSNSRSSPEIIPNCCQYNIHQGSSQNTTRFHFHLTSGMVLQPEAAGGSRRYLGVFIRYSLYRSTTSQELHRPYGWFTSPQTNASRAASSSGWQRTTSTVQQHCKHYEHQTNTYTSSRENYDTSTLRIAVKNNMELNRKTPRQATSTKPCHYVRIRLHSQLERTFTTKVPYATETSEITIIEGVPRQGS